MLQYLLNTTAIWLISLVMFDVFLRRESYHSYNRFYLLFTFLLGALLPLLQWQDNQRIYQTAIGKPLQQVIAAKQTIATATIATTTTINWQLWLTIIYLSGMLVALCLLIIEIIKLSAAYTAKRYYTDGWKVIETGKGHAPFSFLNTLFVCTRTQYNDEEWAMVLTHERRHTSLFHFADLLLMQFARIVFWFHPLVYLYNKRLLLLHEYQADNAAATQPQQYGMFLIEQALLQSAPTLSHSFNRSPIKNRILMLTRRSSIAARTKMLVFIPLFLVCFSLFTKNSFSQQPGSKTKIITFKGNKFEIKPSEFRGVVTRPNPETGKQQTDSVFNDPQPLKMNGKTIYAQDSLITPPQLAGKEQAFWNYLLAPLQKNFEALPDGKYWVGLENVVIDENGKMVYYEFNGVRSKGKELAGITGKINKELDQLNSSLKIKPAQLNGRSILYWWTDLGFEEVAVKNHTATF